MLAGTGNNGGDGLAAARHLHRWGRLVRVCCTDRSKLKDAAALEADALEAAGVRIEDDLVLDGAEAVVDALLGTGLSRPPNGRYAAWIDVVNASGLEVVSVDVPSGLESDSGEMLEPCVRASRTVTLGLPKPGLLTKSAKAMVGEIEVVDIGLPAPALSAVGIETRGIFVDSDRFTITDE